VERNRKRRRRNCKVELNYIFYSSIIYALFWLDFYYTILRRKSNFVELLQDLRINYFESYGFISESFFYCGICFCMVLIIFFFDLMLTQLLHLTLLHFGFMWSFLLLGKLNSQFFNSIFLVAFEWDKGIVFFSDDNILMP